MKTTIVPRGLSNGSDALRLLDYFRYTPKEASCLFAAAPQCSKDAEGAEIFSMLEHTLEALLILETHGLLEAEEWQGVIRDANYAVEELLMRLGERVRPAEPAHGFRLVVEYAA